MKGVFLSLLVIYAAITTAQVKVNTIGRVVSDEGQQIIVTDSLYPSFFNKIFVAADNIPFSKLEISADSVQIIKENGQHPHTKFFYARVTGHQRSVVLKIFASKNLIYSMPFVVLSDIPNLPVKFCNEVRGEVPRLPRELTCMIVEDKLRVLDGDSTCTIRFDILSFTACIKSHEKMIYEERFLGSNFSRAFNDKVQNCRNGDEILITSILVKDHQNGNTYRKENQYKFVIIQ